MIENLLEKLKQVKCKQLKSAKISTSIRWELECLKCSKIFCKTLGAQNVQD